MKVQFVSIAPTDKAEELGCLALTPELLAATGARYSRNNEGLEAIASKIDFNNKDKSVDGIFKMIDYGHQSIADMTPIALFIDDISLFAAYYLWTLSPTAGGQECSTRYIKMGPEFVVNSEDLGIPSKYDLNFFNKQAFDHYQRTTDAWSSIIARDPKLARIPESLINSDNPKDQRQVERMKRNYVFDRARVHLPLSAKTGLMMIQSARAWANVASHLQSHNLKELIKLGAEIADKMSIGAPRLLKHTKPNYCHSYVIQENFELMKNNLYLASNNPLSTDLFPTESILEVNLPNKNRDQMLQSMSHRKNRYSPFGMFANLTSVKFGWKGIAFGDIRDLNRHRTGNKYINLCPLGFYGALDQIPEMCEESNLIYDCNYESRNFSMYARSMIADNIPEYIYFCKLGTQFQFEHLTTADKFIYEMELRTGLGAHYKYAEHCAEVLKLWYSEFQETKGVIFEGTAEPE